MPTATDDFCLSFGVLRYTRMYTDGLRELIEEKLIERLQSEDRAQATLADVQACIGPAFTEYSEQMKKCSPDAKMVSDALRDLEVGDYQDVNEIIDELQGSHSEVR